MDFNNEQWHELKQTETGLKILVTGEGTDMRSVVFKNGGRRPGPTIFNEYLAFKLGQLLNYPIPRVQFLHYNGELGCISFYVPESTPWQAFPQKENALTLLEDDKIFAKLVAFDLWIKHGDRHDRNLIVQNIAVNRYKVYFIDHEHALYGPDQAPPPNILDFSNIVRITQMKSYIPTIDLLLTEVDKITKISDDEIKGLVDNLCRISDNQFSPTQAQIVKDLLTQRKALLRQKAEEWYNTSQ